MHRKDMFITNLIIVFISVCSFQIGNVNSADILDFWVRDQELDTRRAKENDKNKIVSDTNQQKFRYNRSKSVNKYTHSIEELLESESKQGKRGRNTNEIKNRKTHSGRGRDSDQKRSRAREISQSLGRVDDQKQNRGRETSQSRVRADDRQRDRDRNGHSLRQGDSDDGKWPKQRHRSNVKSRRHYPLSTRMTPMYLRQKPEEQTKTAIYLNENIEPETLSAYSISQQMNQIMAKFPEANVTQEIVGRTVSYNDIVLLKITADSSNTGKYFRADETKYADEMPEKKIIFIVHGLTVMGMDNIPCLSTIQEFSLLVSYYLAHLDKFDIFLMPMANPDGYAYSSLGINWNKNLSPQSACPGVALDRNFDVAWNTSRTTISCSQLYPGTSPFSEAETKAVRDVLHRYSQKIIAYLHVHGGSYSDETFKGEAVLYPKGYTDSQTDDDKYLDLKGEIDEAMKNASFQVMSVTMDSLYNWYGKVSGSSVDYAATVYGVPYALELVMQVYTDPPATFGPPKLEELISHKALEEIWKRSIDVIFNNVWKNMHANDMQ